MRFILPSRSPPLCLLPPPALPPAAQLLHPVPPGLCTPALLSLGFFPPFPLVFHQSHLPLLLPFQASSQPLRCLSLLSPLSLSVLIIVINTLKGLSITSISRAPVLPSASEPWVSLSTPENHTQASMVHFRRSCVEKVLPTKGHVEGFALNRRICSIRCVDRLLSTKAAWKVL